VLVEQSLPSLVTKLDRLFGGIHDIGEQQRGEHTVRLSKRTRACEKLFNLVYDAIDIAGPDRMISAG
jgi:hypothetical protein